MPSRYWRFAHLRYGTVCGPCAWVLAYHGDPATPFEVPTPVGFRCKKCGKMGYAVQTA